MPDLLNSQRRLFKATYAPIGKVPADRSGRAAEKAAYVRSLALKSSEISALANDSAMHALTVQVGKSPPLRLINVIRSFAADSSALALQRYGPTLAHTSFTDLAGIGKALVAMRHATAPPASSGEANRALGPSNPVLSPADKTAAVVNQFDYSAPITPVGQIHLERLEMTPVGVEHGELVHSVPLSPKETVNVTRREWSATTQTFENLTQDAFEGFSEQGVTEKTDLSQASDLESKHSSSLDVNGSVSATYNGGAYSVTANAAFDYGSKEDQQQSAKNSIAHSIAITRNASARTKKEHKTSFRVSSVAAAENLAIEVITNPSDTQAMRVDYYQLLRKWRVDLIRYGLRMTYDIAIPNPGYGLISKVIELKQLSETIVHGNTFSLDPTTISPSNYLQFEQQFGASVDAPPTPSIELWQTSTVPQKTYDAWGAQTVQFEVPEGYLIASGHFRGMFSVYASDGHHLQVNVLGEPAGTTNVAGGEYQGHDAILEFDLTKDTLLAASGTVFLVYDYHNVDFGTATVNITAEPTPETIQAWQSKVWSQLRAADQANYETRLALARDRQAQLEAEIAAFDALTLRKMEREEIMRLVIQWLFGPNFALMPDNVLAVITTNVTDPPGQPSGLFAFPDVHNLAVNDWQTIVQHGELIKYIHNAIEWENVIFFSFPYFWDRLQNWQYKRFLMHPDSIHRDFLRAGCARVVLPVRPGFETSFAMLMETGDGNAPPDTTYPYVTIGEEIRNYAMTNYENIPPANPDHNVRTLLYFQQRTAWGDIQDIMKALAQYHQDNGNTFPKTLADPKLQAAAAKAGVALPANDPWGNPYDYSTPGVFGDYDLASHGTKAHPEVDGLDGDITSWAEGSVVGRWYEYTPTSALDVAVTMIAVGGTPLATQPAPA